MKKYTILLLAFVISLFLLTNLIVGGGADEKIKTYDDVKKQITLKQGAITTAEYTLTRNTAQCLIDCSAEGMIHIHTNSTLFDTLKFQDSSLKSKSITSKIYLGTNKTVTADVDINATIKKVQVDKIVWEEYNGEILSAGTYYWKIEAKKSLTENVDWIAGSSGIDFVEWAWWNNSWDRKMKLTINHSLIQSDLVNFTVALYFNASNINFSLTYNNGTDIRFLNGSETSELSYEIEQWNKTLELGKVFVLIPFISSTVDTEFYMYFNNTGANSSTENAVNAWDKNHMIILHMKEGAGVEMNDSLQLRNFRADTTIEWKQGFISGSSIVCDGTDSIGSYPSQYSQSGNYSASIAVFVNSTNDNSDDIFRRHQNVPAVSSMILQTNSTNGLFWAVSDGSPQLAANKSMINNSWNFISMSASTSGNYLYLNGELVGYNSTAGSMSPAAGSIGLCVNNYNGLNRVKADLDEFRVQNQSRSTAWHIADFYSQNNSLISYGTTGQNLVVNINITTPLNTTYTSIQSALNYTTSVVVPQACWYSTNLGVTNTTITCGTNITGLNSGQGSSTWKVYANDSSGNQNSTSVTFFVDSINPSILFTNPTETNNSYLNRTYISINVSINDTNLNIHMPNDNFLCYQESANVSTSCGGLATGNYLVEGSWTNPQNMYDEDFGTYGSSVFNTGYNNFTINYTKPSNSISATWRYKDANNDDINISISNTCFNNNGNILTVKTEQANGGIGASHKVFCYNSTAWEELNIPSFGTLVGMYEEGIYWNISYNATKSLTTKIYNSTGLVNSTDFYISPYNITYFNLPNGVYYFNATAYDILNNQNTTETRTVTIDTVNPVINLDSPLGLTYRDEYDYNISLNVSATDATPISSWLYSLNAGVTNTSFTPNASVIFPAGTSTLFIYANDSAGNRANVSVNLALRFTPKINQTTISNSSTSYSRYDFINNINTVAYYSFDENRSDNIVNSSKGTYAGSSINTTFTENGKIGGAYDFINYFGKFAKVYTPISQSVLNLSSSDFSLCAWFYNKGNMYNSSGSQMGQQIITTYPGSSPQVTVQYDYSNQRIQIQTRNSTNTITTNAPTSTSLRNTWSHVCMVVNRTEGPVGMQRVYINGVDLANGSIATDRIASINITIGGPTATGETVSAYFNGTIDEVLIMNKSMTSTEVYSLYSITNPTFQEYANVTINTSITDEDTAQNSLWYRWLVNSVERLSGFGQNVFNWIFTGSNDVTDLYVNDSQNYSVHQQWNITTTYINPQINFTSLTDSNYGNYSKTYIQIGIALNETNFQNITYRLYNSTNSLLNTTTYTSQFIYFNFTNLANGRYKFNVSATDKVNNINTTETRTITLDTTNPNATLLSPSNNTYSNSLNQNYTANITDNLGIKNATIYIYNSTNSLVNRTTVSETSESVLNHLVGINVTLTSGVYKWFYQLFDWSGNTFVTQNNTITLDTTTPLISFISPTQNTGVNVSSTSVILNVSITETNLANITFSIYNLTAQVNRTTFSTSTTSITFVNLPNTHYTYQVNITDLANNKNATEVRTIRVDTTNPSATLISPSDNAYTLDTTQNYTSNITDNLGIKNATLNIYNSTNGLVNRTTVSETSGSVLNKLVGVVVTLTDGVYKWFYQLFDWSGNTYVTQNNTLTIDTIRPGINIIYPQNTTYTAIQSALNYTLLDINTQACWYSTNSGVTNTTITCGTNITGLNSGQGSSTWKVYANDSAGNQNSSTVTFFVDSITPTISYVSPTLETGLYRNQNYIQVNVSSGDTNLANKTINLYNSTLALINSTTKSSLGNIDLNFSNLTDGIYYYNATNTDGLGNKNSTETRNITLDTTTPLIAFISPTKSDRANVSSTSITVNVSLTEINTANITYSLYNQTTLVNRTVYTTNTTSITFLNLPNAIYSYEVNVTDLVNLKNATGVRVITLDTGVPVVTIDTPTSTTYRDEYDYNISLNVSASDFTPISNWFYSLDSGVTNTTFSPNISIIYPAGTSTLKVYANDSAGNIGNSTVNLALRFTPKINQTTISNSSTSYNRTYLTTQAEGVVAYWRFDKNWSSQEDYSSNSNNYNATVQFNATFTPEGKYGGAYSLDDKDIQHKITIPNTTDDFEVGNHTFMIWVKPNALYNNQFIFDHYNWRFILSSTAYNFEVGRMENETGPTNETGNQYSASSATAVANKWTLLTGIYSPDIINGNGNIKLYVDGILKATTSIERQKIWVEYGTYNVQWGNSNHGAAVPFNGTIDDTIILNRSLSDSEVFNYYSITNPTFQEYANVTINATIADEDTAQNALWYSWLVNGVERLSGMGQSIFNWIFAGRNDVADLYVNDSQNYSVHQQWNITTTYINPQITILYPLNNTLNTTNNQIAINYSYIEANPSSCYWTNNSGTLNYSIACGTNITGQTWREGINNIHIYITDVLGNNGTNHTSFRVDTTPPAINIAHPQTQTYGTNNSLSLNFTVTDTTTYVSSCLYSIRNATDYVISNTTLANCQNTTFSLPRTDSYLLNLYANDSLNNLANSSVVFGISLNAPAMSLDYPANNKFLQSTNVSLNFTAIDVDGISSCLLYSDFNGTWMVNETFNSITSGVQVHTEKTLSDRQYKWNIYCNDTFNNADFGISNYTFTVDTINPNITINSIQTTTGSQMIVFNATSNDTNLQSCWYSIFNLAGTIDGSSSNVSYTCNTNTNATVSSFASYTLKVYANDSSGRESNSSSSFTVTQTSSGGGGGGGGGGGSTTIITDSGKLWKMTTSSGTGAYLLQIPAGGDSIRILELVNQGTKEVVVTLRCEGVACDFIELDKTSLTLPASVSTVNQIKTTITIPDNTAEQTYLAKIYAKDAAGAETSVEYSITVSPLGNVVQIVEKTFKINDKIPLPNLLIIFVIGILAYIIIQVFGFGIKTKEIKRTLGLIVAVIAMIVTLILI